MWQYVLLVLVAHFIVSLGDRSSTFDHDIQNINLMSSPTTSPSGSYSLSWYDSTAIPAAYTAVASSSSGQYLLAVTNYDGIIYSSNYGETWTLFLNSLIATAVANSCSGQYGYTATSTSTQAKAIYTTDYGVSWALSNIEVTNVQAIACSCSGQYVYLSSNSGQDMYYSSNYGVTFTSLTVPNGAWNSIAVDYSGSNVIIANSNVGGNVLISSNSGLHWTTTSAPSAQWTAVASDSTGTYLAASASSNDGVWISADGGLVWTQATAIPTLNVNYQFITISSTGQYMAVANSLSPGADTFPVLLSNNYGASWTSSTSPGTDAWLSLAADASGQRLVGAYSGTMIYLGVNQTFAPTPGPTTSSIPTPSATNLPTTRMPTLYPSLIPSCVPTVHPSEKPTSHPSDQPISRPTCSPYAAPSSQPSRQPTRQPTGQPSRTPSNQPSKQPFSGPTSQPSRQPFSHPTSSPFAVPSSRPSRQPTRQPSGQPSHQPSGQPVAQPSNQPSSQPVSRPSSQPSTTPSMSPSMQPSCMPLAAPTANPTTQPSSQPSLLPSTVQPTVSHAPTVTPSAFPSTPTAKPTGGYNLIWYDTSAPVQDYTAVSSSSSGQYLTTVVENVGIYYSDNYGISWTLSNSGSYAAIEIVSSCSGQYSFTGSTSSVNVPALYSNDYGQKWYSSSLSIGGVDSLDCSCSGEFVYLVSSKFANSVFFSQNYGLDYVQLNAPSGYWEAVTCDYSGQNVVIAGYGSEGVILTSTSYGAVWITTQAPIGYWSNLASDSSGQHLLASSNYGRYVSTDSGMTWTQVFNVSAANYTTYYVPVLVSSSGQYMALTYAGGEGNSQLHLSNNYGLSWTMSAAPYSSAENWFSLSMSADGQRIIGAYSNGHVYLGVNQTASPTTQPTVSAKPSTHKPSAVPTTHQPSFLPTTLEPTVFPSSQPSSRPLSCPSYAPSIQPTSLPSCMPSNAPTGNPSVSPVKTSTPSSTPSTVPSLSPRSPSSAPSVSHSPSLFPTDTPSANPILDLSTPPSESPSTSPSTAPSEAPSVADFSNLPTSLPSLVSMAPIVMNSTTSIPSSLSTITPSVNSSELSPFALPSVSPSTAPSHSTVPSAAPSAAPSASPSELPSVFPVEAPSLSPSLEPSITPSMFDFPSEAPSLTPSLEPSITPSMFDTPSVPPSFSPSTLPSSVLPSSVPSSTPVISTFIPTSRPSRSPRSRSIKPNTLPVFKPLAAPTSQPSVSIAPSATPVPSFMPSSRPSARSTESSSPMFSPTFTPSVSFRPTKCPTVNPTIRPSILPSFVPSTLPSTLSPTVHYTLNWTTSDAPSLNWYGITVSGNGQYLVAVAYQGGVFYSTNYGYHWLKSNASSSGTYLCVCSSKSGQYVAVGSQSDGIIVSQNYGRNFTLVTNTLGVVWLSLASASSGQIMYAGSSDSFMFTSKNYGATWGALDFPVTTKQSVACDSSGQYIIAVISQIAIYTSHDFGSTWQTTYALNSAQWTTVVSDSSGQYCVAIAENRGIFTSNNYGLNWTLSLDTTQVSVKAISSDSSGANLAAVVTNGYSFLSANYGQTWTQSGTETAPWSSIASDNSGFFVAASIYDGVIIIGSNTTYIPESYAPSLQPTDSSKTQSSGELDLRGISEASLGNAVFICIPGMFLLLSRFIVLSFRYSYNDKDGINQLNSTTYEVLETLLKAVNIVLGLSALVFSQDGTYSAPVIFLFLARIIIFAAWCLFICVLILPGGGADKSNNSQQPNLFLFLSNKVMQDKMHIRFCFVQIFELKMRAVILGVLFASMFDMTMLRLLPWTRSEFTDRVQGYPNMFIVRCCLYSNFLSSFFQCLASVLDVVSNQNDRFEAYLFIVVSSFATILSFLSVAMFAQLAKTSSLKVSITFTTGSSQGGDSKSSSSLQQEDEIELHSRATTMFTKDSNTNSSMIVPPPVPIDIEAPLEVENPIIMSQKASPPKKRYDIAEEEETVTDERGIIFNTKIKYADETMNILKEQLVTKGFSPLEYIPLKALKAELEDIFAAANNGIPYDEQRLDYLLTCMDYNPEYKREKEEESRLWTSEITEYCNDCLDIMRGFISPNIFSSSVAYMTKEDNYSVELAKRLIGKKCLWLVRISKSDIERMHIAELQGRFNPQAQGLDIVETAAIYAALPTVFSRDNKKEIWRKSFESQLKVMDKERRAGKLPKIKLRHNAYKNQLPRYEMRETMHEMQTLSGNDAFKPRESFRSLRLNSTQTVDIVDSNVGDTDTDNTSERLLEQHHRPGRLETTSSHLSGVKGDLTIMLRKELDKR